MIKCDLTKYESISEILEEQKPDYIIHAAAERAPDRVENKPEETKLLNIIATSNIAKIAS